MIKDLGMYLAALKSAVGINKRTIQMDSVDAIDLITRLIEAEKDAERYRRLMQLASLGIGQNGKDWDLYFDGPAPDNITEIDGWLDKCV